MTRDERTYRTLRAALPMVLTYGLVMFFATRIHAEVTGPPAPKGYRSQFRSITCTTGIPVVCRYSDTGELVSGGTVEVEKALTVNLADRMALHAGVIGFAFAADMGTTSWALRRCPTCFERGFGPDVEARTALHIGYGTAALGACWLLERSGHRGWARVVAAGTAGVFGGAALSNSIHAIRRR